MFVCDVNMKTIRECRYRQVFALDRAYFNSFFLFIYFVFVFFSRHSRIYLCCDCAIVLVNGTLKPRGSENSLCTVLSSFLWLTKLTWWTEWMTKWLNEQETRNKNQFEQLDFVTIFIVFHLSIWKGKKKINKPFWWFMYDVREFTFCFSSQFSQNVWKKRQNETRSVCSNSLNIFKWNVLFVYYWWPLIFWKLCSRLPINESKGSHSYKSYIKHSIGNWVHKSVVKQSKVSIKMLIQA